MIEFQNGGRLAQSMRELPKSFVGAGDVYLDFETTSGDHEKMSVNPWHNCSIAGFAITVDICEEAYYFDYMRASESEQLYAIEYLNKVLYYANNWINHNIKYDVHVATNAGVQCLHPWLALVCTLTRAKLIDSDRGGARGGYALDKLSAAWLQHDINPLEDRLQPYLGRANKDYGQIPADILGEYACQDVLTVRNLYRYINGRLPERCQNVANTEVALTKELVKVEQEGMRFDLNTLKVAQYRTLNRMFDLDKELSVLVGRSFRPSVNNDCNEVLCGQYGLPVLAYTKDDEGDETENASFDKKALAMYAALPYAPQDVISRIIEYRKLSQRNNLYLTPWQELAIKGVLHPNYNQTVRTGRMSCSEPNMQQLDDFMLALILPPPGHSFISTDASQIEFRLITHYIQDPKAVAEYNANPDADFHALVAALCGIKRKPAKTINFGTAFGEGMKKIIAQISTDPDIIALVKDEVDCLNLASDSERIQAFNRIIEVRGQTIYKTYHKTFPTLKATAKAAEAVCKSPERRLGTALDADHYYGYITNMYGRDRHLPYYGRYRTDYKTADPYDKAWLSFPTLNQASAADLMKERFVCLMQEHIRELPIKAVGIVHDELVFTAPTEIAEDPRTLRDIVAVLESPAVEISVPIRWSIGTSSVNWLSAATPVADGGVSNVIQYNKADATGLDFLRG